MKKICLIYPAALLTLTAVPAIVTAQFRPIITPPITHPVPISLPAPTAGLNPGITTPTLQPPTLQPSLPAGGAPTPQPSPSVFTDTQRGPDSGHADQVGQPSVSWQVVPPAPPDNEPPPDGGDEEPEASGTGFPWWPVAVGCILVLAFLGMTQRETKP